MISYYSNIISMRTVKFFIVIMIMFFPLVFADALDLSNAADLAKNTAGSAGFKTDNTGADVFDKTIGTIIQAALSLIGIIFLVLMIYGGFLWMTDRGNEQQVKRAQNLISAAVIGLIIVLSAYAISYFVLSKLQAGTLN